MNTRATENFISLPYTSEAVISSLEAHGIFQIVLFFLRYIEDKRPRSHVLQICYSICFSCADMS